MKIHFLPLQNLICHDKLHLGEHDVCLSNVDALYILGDKKRKLIPGRNASEKVKGLYVLCKVMSFILFFHLIRIYLLKFFLYYIEVLLFYYSFYLVESISKFKLLDILCFYLYILIIEIFSDY